MALKKIRTALISVYEKEGLDQIVDILGKFSTQIISTGGTAEYILGLGKEVTRVETLTGFPSILGGRVKTLHPAIFGGILAKREGDHLSELRDFDLPQIDLVIVDLYPFEETVRNSVVEDEIIEKIDIGGISLIRAGAKNYHSVLVVSSRSQYRDLTDVLIEGNGYTSLETRRKFAMQAFLRSSQYDQEISAHFAGSTNGDPETYFEFECGPAMALRYGENPMQKGTYFGKLDLLFRKLSGKNLSYNNLIDIDAAVNLMRDFAHRPNQITFAILKHTNPCGIATRASTSEAWHAALQGDPVSAFGGILITNGKIDLTTAEAIDNIFYEVLIAQDFDKDAKEHLSRKEKRILLQLNHYPVPGKQFRSILNGVISQDQDVVVEASSDMKTVTHKAPKESEIADLVFANICVKHLKSNAISIVRNKQLIGMGCGQTSRVDALKQAISKAEGFGFELMGAVLASDAFFPFADCVEIADAAGITAVVQPGGSIRDKDSVDYCNNHGMSMVVTGSRHFKH